MSAEPDMSLDDAIKEVNRIQNLFICNEYCRAIQEAEKRMGEHFMLQLLRALLKSINGVVTFQEDDLQEALESIQSAITCVDHYRRKRNRISRLIWTPDYDEYTDTECQAEGCYSVLTACMAGMTLLVEKSFVGLVKAAYWGKASLDILRECKVIVNRRTNWSSETSKEAFCHGVFFGLGFYNLVVSFVPRRVLSLLKFFGYRGSRTKAFGYMMKVASGETLWAPVAAISILGHHCFAEFIVGIGNPDIALVQQLLHVFRSRYPGSGFFLVFEGTVRLMKGLPLEAIQFYEKSIEKFVDWQEWQYACHWFITWCYAILCDWENALKHTKILVDNCNWSKCVFMYQYAAILKMTEEETDDPITKSKLNSEIDHYLRTAPTFKQSFAGKTIFVEKFVTKRCQIYWSEKKASAKHASSNKHPDDAFMLPILDLFLFWNIFYTFKSSPVTGSVFLSKVESKLKSYPEDGPDEEKHFYLVLMRGIILKNLGQQEAAINCLTDVLDHQFMLKRYSHLAPLACLELGTLFQQVNNPHLASSYLNKATNDYSHYLNETTVHIRAHAVLESLKKGNCNDGLGSRKMSAASLASISSKLSYVFFPATQDEDKE